MGESILFHVSFILPPHCYSAMMVNSKPWFLNWNWIVQLYIDKIYDKPHFQNVTNKQYMPKILLTHLVDACRSSICSIWWFVWFWGCKNRFCQEEIKIVVYTTSRVQLTENKFWCHKNKFCSLRESISNWHSARIQMPETRRDPFVRTILSYTTFREKIKNRDLVWNRESQISRER